jgi:hypothetical protein
MTEKTVKRKKCFPEGSRGASPLSGKQDTADIRYREKRKIFTQKLAGIAIIKERGSQPVM